VIDLLPDRKAATAKAWMQAHPEIKLVSRDRGGDYATVQIEGESCRIRKKYLPLFGPYCEKNSPLDHLT
jgi:hypothetical protein